MCGRVFTADKSSKFEWHTAHV